MPKALPSLAWLLLVSAAVALPWSQDAPKTGEPAVGVLGSTPPLQVNSAQSLYLQLCKLGLAKSRIYRLRDISIDRAAFHITLNDGTIAFTEDVAGRVTGAFFEGDGEILLSPPNQYERASMALFTGEAILEERFVTAYFRFNDDTFAELRPSLMPVDYAEAFLSQWNETARNLAEGDALRLLMTFSKFLPVGQPAEDTAALVRPGEDDRFLHARLQGLRLGTFDLYFDADTPEQIWAGQLKTVEGASYYDVWTSFSSAKANRGAEAVNATVGEGGKPDSIAISHYAIRTKIKPPTQIDAEALLQMEVRQGGQRAVLFELSRALQIKRVEADGHPIEFIHNPAIEGTQLARHGNDLVAVVFPQPLRTGQRLELRFVYDGEVLYEAGAGLLYVGARGTWYPNRGLAMSNFDLEFRYPAGWTLVATGKRTDARSSPNRGAEAIPPAGEQVSRWVSERPIPLAGFDLGKYERVVAPAGEVTVETYATSGMERGFPMPPVESVIPSPLIRGVPPRPPLTVAPPPPSPARNAQMVAAASAHAIEFFSRRYGPFPYGDLKVVQIPGGLSQGWPGLIFLSSTSFLTAEEKSQLHMSSVEKTLVTQIIAHETAHQWWGDLVMWSGYRDQWIVEALANYSSMMVLERENPAQFRAAMEKYRDDLLQKNKAGVRLMEDGPVTLGTRLSCSQFPSGYEVISYGRGTWLFHMLRSMMRDAERSSGASARDNAKVAQSDEPFVRVLRRVRERYQGKPITTRELLQAFEEELPSSLWYEHHKSLDWFYEGWVNGTSIPRFELHTVKYSDQSGSTTITGTILQRDAPDNLVTPVPLYISVAGRMVLLGRVFADGAETPFHLTAPLGARKVVVDPDHTLLARSR
jgi:Peptidase family M1 domain